MRLGFIILCLAAYYDQASYLHFRKCTQELLEKVIFCGSNTMNLNCMISSFLPYYHLEKANSSRAGKTKWYPDRNPLLMKLYDWLTMLNKQHKNPLAYHSYPSDVPTDEDLCITSIINLKENSWEKKRLLAYYSFYKSMKSADIMWQKHQINGLEELWEKWNSFLNYAWPQIDEMICFLIAIEKLELSCYHEWISITLSWLYITAALSLVLILLITSIGKSCHTKFFQRLCPIYWSSLGDRRWLEENMTNRWNVSHQDSMLPCLITFWNIQICMHSFTQNSQPLNWYFENEYIEQADTFVMNFILWFIIFMWNSHLTYLFSTFLKLFPIHVVILSDFHHQPNMTTFPSYFSMFYISWCWIEVRSVQLIVREYRTWTLNCSSHIFGYPFWDIFGPLIVSSF